MKARSKHLLSPLGTGRRKMHSKVKRVLLTKRAKRSQRCGLTHLYTMNIEKPSPLNALVPIYKRERGNRVAEHIGSAIWACFKGKNFPLTAAHVFDENGECSDQLEVPMGDTTIPLLGSFCRPMIRKSGKPDELGDVAYCHITQDLAERLRPEQEPLSERTIDSQHEHKEGSLYVIGGFPCECSTDTELGSSVALRALIGQGTHTSAFRKLRFEPALQILIRFSIRNCFNFSGTGAAGSVPAPFGMSGGGIFVLPTADLLKASGGDTWTAQSFSHDAFDKAILDCKLVAITTDWDQRHAVFAGTRIGWLLETIRNHHSDVAT